MELWRDIPDYEGLYQASTLGRIRSLTRDVTDSLGRKRTFIGQILRPSISGRGKHLACFLSVGGKGRTVTIHQAVAAAWIGPCPPNCRVRHKSSDRNDNSFSNLCYGTQAEIEFDKWRDGTHRGSRVRRSDGREYPSMIAAAKDTECFDESIWYACNGRYKTAGGYGWEYISQSQGEQR